MIRLVINRFMGDSPVMTRWTWILASLLLACSSPALFCHGQEKSGGIFGALPERFSARIKPLEARLQEVDQELALLPVMPDIDALGTHGFHSNFGYESEVHWLQVTWDQPQEIDGIAMIPTRLTTQSGMRSNYGLPNRLRIEATRDGESEPFTLAEVQDTRLDLRQGEPIFLEVKASDITSLRVIPVDLPTLPGKDVRFFSLAELMVYHGKVNIVSEGRLSANYSIDGEVGWNLHYLIDSQSPLGPPELPQPGKSLGWHGDLSRGPAKPTWAVIDLGESQEFDAVRLVAARGDAPVKGPGFGFPVIFRLESADSTEGDAWQTLWSSGERDYPNPGYNPVTVKFPSARGRFVRLSVDKLHAPDNFVVPRILLSEMEILHGGANLALGRPVLTPDSYESIGHDAKRVWSRAGLTDGHSSTGLLMPEREWVQSLSRRFDLICEKNLLRVERAAILDYWHRLGLALTIGTLSVAILALGFRLIRVRLVNQRTVAAIRSSISSDLHDEVGSNLATIALLSELRSSPANLDDINRLARETSLALREIVDITLAPKRARKPLLDRLRDIASLMLRDHEWTFEGDESPSFDLEQRKHLVFFFKESLHNIIRHAGAKKVRIVLEKRPPHFSLTIQDDGCGILDSPPDVMGNLHTLRQRAERLRGSFSVESAPGQGTLITLLFPIQNKK
jgi:two-component sensor histidine kinase